MNNETTSKMTYDEIMDRIVKEQCAIRRLNVRKMELDDEIAGDVEEVYEKTTGKSCVRYIDRDGCLSEDLAGRTGDEETRGYTDAFETWGFRKANEAIRMGLNTRETVIQYVKDNPEDTLTTTFTADEIDTLLVALSEAEDRRVLDGGKFSDMYERLTKVQDGLD